MITQSRMQAALELAACGWEVIPLNGKIPVCEHGVKDATTDEIQIMKWWGRRDLNIGARVPDGMVVIDVDPRHDGLANLDKLIADHGPLPDTLTTISGRGDGGGHLYFLCRTDVTSRQLPEGIDLKTRGGYLVMPPSVHPDTKKPYQWKNPKQPPVRIPDWLRAILSPEQKAAGVIAPAKTASFGRRFTGPSVADEFCENTTWPDILEPRGWTCLDSDPDADGARWRHPQATSKWSATVKNGCLFNYSPNSGLPVTEAGDPRGLTKFHAYACIYHGGDRSLAARQLKGNI